MRIRLATQGDISGLARVHVDSWHAAYHGILPEAVLDSLSVPHFESVWQRNLENAERVTFVCEREGCLLGWAAIGPSRDEDARAGVVGELYGIYSLPSVWGQGIGQALWQAARGGLAEMAFSEATLWVFCANARARGFYEKMGFVLDKAVSKAVERFGVAPSEVRYRIQILRSDA
jgi:GNAT superfamily N-acetyltransferase